MVRTLNLDQHDGANKQLRDRGPAFRDARPPAAVLHTINPVVRVLLSSPLHRVLSHKVMVLEVTGRRTGRRLSFPVGRYPRGDGTFLISAGGRWRHNIRGGANVNVVLDGRRRAGYAVLEENPQRAARLFLDLLSQAGPRALAVKFAGEPPTTLEELRPALTALLKDRGVAVLSVRDC
jgi:F420H(2)-dependent quinone reductase